ncbi:MAG: adenylosuccinate synthase [Spirochaetaceae bacterium]|jgi:adenylosuccinate synthase|nr:adenylosuccinate synthase [Spirochaetaceae bacterium]
MNIVIIGAQWGDEGKGKIVDFLAGDAEAIVRYAGGANAGHTIVIDRREYALHLIPSGILYPGKQVFLGGGMVIDPQALFEELRLLEERGIDWQGRVFISDRAHLVLPRYRKIDVDRDAVRKKPIGTTGRGIGVAYALKSERVGVRLADLDNGEALGNLETGDTAFLDQYRDRLLAMKTDMAAELYRLRGKNVLFEGAQGSLLDIDSGTYPYVSSGLSSAAGAASGSGVGPRALDKVLGVCKAYTTRVGNGPLPTEFDQKSQSALYQFVRDTGREYGVTTGRARRCGSLDLVALRYACRVNSLDALVLTHLDVYDTLDEVEVCVAYDIAGKRVTDFPGSIADLTAAKPVLRKFPGWKTPVTGTHTFKELPQAAKNYIEFIEEFTETPVDTVSVGYERTQTIVRNQIWS